MLKSSSFSVFLISVLLLSLTAGCSATETTTEADDPEPNYSEMEERYWERIKESRMNFTQSDIDFMYGMIPHHAQALIMSRLAPENEAGQSIQILAARIINAQGDEIDLMKKWLRDRDQPVPEIHIDGLEMMVHMGEGHDGHHAMHDHSDMPGMLSQNQLEELAAATGREFDRLFLEYMIEHHRGAIVMVDELFAADGAASDREIFDLASGINAEQVTEIERMKLMLDRIE